MATKKKLPSSGWEAYRGSGMGWKVRHMRDLKPDTTYPFTMAIGTADEQGAAKTGQVFLRFLFPTRKQAAARASTMMKDAIAAAERRIAGANVEIEDLRAAIAALEVEP